MKTFTTAGKTGMRIIATGNMNKNRRYSEKEIADTIIDSFNDQLYISSRNKKKIGNMINSTVNESPNNGVKFQKVIDLFLESSHQLMNNYMKNALDSYLVLNDDGVIYYMPPSVSYNNTEEEIIEKKNSRWMQDWMDQMSFFKDESEAISFMVNEENEFYNYWT